MPILTNYFDLVFQYSQVLIHNAALFDDSGPSIKITVSDSGVNIVDVFFYLYLNGDDPNQAPIVLTGSVSVLLTNMKQEEER